MSWALVERLRQRFPEIEPYPHEDGQAAEEHQAPAAPVASRPAARHDAKGPTFHTLGAYVPADRLIEICRVLRDEAPYHMDYCSFVSAIDRPQQSQLEVVYHLFSMATGDQMLLKVRLPRDQARVASVTPLWSGANWHERETYDLFGIAFEGHPDLRRIMMTDDWQGHPLRKDYQYQEPRWLVDLATQRQREIEGLGLGERA